MRDKHQWLIKWVRRIGLGQYWARVTSTECLEPGAPWEEISFCFRAPDRRGPRVLRRVCNESAERPMTAEEFQRRAHKLGSQD